MTSRANHPVRPAASPATVDGVPLGWLGGGTWPGKRA